MPFSCSDIPARAETHAWQELPSPSHPSRGPVRATLRAAIRPVHEALHRATLFTVLSRGEATLADYAAVLLVFWRFHASMAPLCPGGAAALGMPDLASQHQQRLDRLRRDLRYLGAVPGALPAAPSLLNASEQIGALYAVLGSALGGLVLNGAIARLLPTGDGRAFVAGDANDRAAWQAFCARLEAYVEAQPDSWSGLATGARAAFDQFQACMEAGQ